MSDNLKFNSDTNTLTVKSVDGVVYKIDNKVVEGEVKLNKTTVVKAFPVAGRVFPKGAEREFKFEVDGDADSNVDDDQVEADPVSVQTAGDEPENVAQQASKAEASARVSGNSPRLP